MNIILQTFDRSDSDKERETESRFPTLEETGRIMEKLMRVIEGVKRRVSFWHMLDWNIHFQNQINVWTSSSDKYGNGPIYMVIGIDCVAECSTPQLEETLSDGGFCTRIRIASAGGRVGINYTDEDIEEEVTEIAEELQKSYKNFHPKQIGIVHT